MKRFLQSEAGAVVLWSLASLVGAAILAPWFYQWGKTLAVAASTGELPAFLEWLGAACGRAKLERFYNRAMLLTALCLLPLLIRRIQSLGRQQGRGNIIDVTKLSLREVVCHWSLAFAIAGGILWATGIVLAEAGAFVAEIKPVDPRKIISKCVLPAIGASLIEEWLFRGLILGLWLRTAKPATAVIGSSLLFSFLHFLKPPSAVADPSHLLAGFELMGRILLHFTETQFFITDFATLTVIGIILCWVRLRTNSLWFPIGLHAGWVFAYALFNLYYDHADHPLHPWGVGHTLRSGLVPMIALAATAAVCHWAIKWLQCPCRKRG